MEEHGLAKRNERFQESAFSFMERMPEELKKAIVEGMRLFAAEFPELASQPRREVYKLAFWDSKKTLSSVGEEHTSRGNV